MAKIKMTYNCPKKWSDMTPVNGVVNARECGKCNIKLVDYASMSDEELTFFLKSGNPKSQCGHFRPNQLSNNNYNRFQHTLIKFRRRVEEKTSSFKVVLLFLLGGMMFLSGCYRHTTCGTYLMDDTEEVVKQNSNN